MKRLLVLLLFFALSLTGLTGCVSTGVFNSTNLTNVELAQDNFRVVATNVSGEASAGYLIGLSMAVGAEARTLGLIRIQGDGLLYKEALEDLWRNYEAEHGPVEGESLALVNVRYDSDALNVLGLYTRPMVSIRADVIAFEE